MPDIAQGLTASEIELIRSTWKPFSENLQESGVTFFLAFFKRQVDYQDAFPFRGVPLNELKQNESFRKHAKSVMKFIDTAITSIEDTPEVLRLLSQNGRSHGQKNLNLSWSHYENVEITLLDVIIQFYEEDKQPLGSVEKETWTKFLRFVLGTIHETVQIHQNAT